MKNRLFLISLTVFLSMFLFNSVVAKEGDGVMPARETVKNALSRNNIDGKNICSAVKKTIEEGLKVRDIVKTGVEFGHSSCLIVKCALDGGGNLEEVISGALDAGATSDVVSRCAIDSGADINEVASTLLKIGPPTLCYFEPDEGLGYSPTETAMIPMDAASPVGGITSGFISPSSF
jgi:hypothetical protein